jgi:hypothetical protein
MKRLALLFALLLAAPACAADTDSASSEEEVDSSEDALALATDTKIKNAIVKTTNGLSYMSESDHGFVWV